MNGYLDSAHAEHCRCSKGVCASCPRVEPLCSKSHPALCATYRSQPPHARTASLEKSSRGAKNCTSAPQPGSYAWKQNKPQRHTCMVPNLDAIKNVCVYAPPPRQEESRSSSGTIREQHGTKRSYSRRNTHQLQLPDQKKGHTPCRAGALIGNRAGNKQDAHTWTCIRSEMKRPRCHTTTGSQQQISATRLLLFAGHTPPIWPAQARKYLQAAVAAASNVSLVHADNMHSLRPCPWSPAPCGAAGSVPLVYMYRHASAIPTARVCPTQLTRCPLMRCLLQSCEQTAATVVSTLTCPAHR